MARIILLLLAALGCYGAELGLGPAPTNLSTATGTVPVANGGTGSTTAATARAALGLSIEQTSGMIETPTAKDYTIIYKSEYALTINEVRIATAGGTCTANFKIDGVSITGLSAIAVTSTTQTVAASAANALASGSTLTVTISAITSAVDLVFTVKETI